MQQIGMIIFRDEHWNTINLDTFLKMKLSNANNYITSLLMNGKLIVGRKTFESFSLELQQSPLYRFSIISRNEKISDPIEYFGTDKEGKQIKKTKEHVRRLKGSSTIFVFPTITSALLYLTKQEINEESCEEESISSYDHSSIYFLGGPMVYKEATDLHMCTFIDDVKINTSLTQGSTFRKIQVEGWDGSDKQIFEKDENSGYSARVKHWKKYPDKKTV